MTDEKGITLVNDSDEPVGYIHYSGYIVSNEEANLMDYTNSTNDESSEVNWDPAAPVKGNYVIDYQVPRWPLLNFITKWFIHKDWVREHCYQWKRVKWSADVIKITK